MKREKFSQQTIASYFNSYGYTLLTTYEKAKGFLTVRCEQGHESRVTYDGFKQRDDKRCHKCCGKIIKITFNDLVTLVSKEGYKLISDCIPKSVHQRVEAICPNGHTITLDYANFRAGKRCKQCHIEKRKQKTLQEHPVLSFFIETSTSFSALEQYSELKRTGVYGIYCLANNRVYIGSSSAKRGLIYRLRCHLADLKVGKHHSILLQRAWDKYGKQNFVFKVVEFVEPSQCVEREQYWLDYYDTSNPKKGFNISPTAKSQLGVKRRQESIEKHRMKMIGRKITEEHKKRLSEFNKGRVMSSESKRKMSESHKGVPKGDNRKKKILYEITSPEGMLFSSSSLTSFCSPLGLHVSAMTRVAKGLQENHKGWKCVQLT